MNHVEHYLWEFSQNSNFIKYLIYVGQIGPENFHLHVGHWVESVPKNLLTANTGKNPIYFCFIKVVRCFFAYHSD